MLKRRALTAVALGLAALGAPAVAAQPNRNLPGADTPRLLVAVFWSSERLAGVQVADAVRGRLESTSNPRQLYIIPKQQMVSFLESSGYKADSSLSLTDLKELAKGLRADEILGGDVARSGSSGYRIQPRLMLAADPQYAQPLPVIETGSLTDAARQIERAVLEARRQIKDFRDCRNFIQASATDKAVAAANAGIVKYPNATIARLCLANAHQAAKKSDSVLKVTDEILKLDPKSALALRFAFTAYKDKADQEPDAVKREQYRELSVRTLVTLLALDPGNLGVQQSVITELAKLGRPSVALPIVDTLLRNNPGDPLMLRQRWLLMLADAADADSASKSARFGRAVAAGEEMVKVDSMLADSAYFTKQIAAAMASSPQMGAEWAARGVTRFPTNQDYWWLRANSERKAGQLQAAQQSIGRLLALNARYPNATLFLGQLFVDLKMVDSAVALAKRAVRAGEDKRIWGSLLLGPAKTLVDAGQALAKDSTSVKDGRGTAAWEAALALSQVVDSLSPSATSKYFVGVSSFQIGYLALSNVGNAAVANANKPKSCALARRAQDMFLLTQTNMPQGGSIDPQTAGQVLGYVTTLSDTADKMIKAYCK